jgi:hypothetical protein
MLGMDLRLCSASGMGGRRCLRCVLSAIYSSKFPKTGRTWDDQLNNISLIVWLASSLAEILLNVKSSFPTCINLYQHQGDWKSVLK